MRYIDEEDISNKRVIVRCDFNVPIKDGVIEDDSRIQKALVTIKYLLDRNCSLVLMSHLGRVKTKDDKIKNSLKVVAERLSELLNINVKFISSPVGMEVLTAAKSLNPKEIILLENTRFCDYPEKLESSNDDNLAKYWSSLGDVFILDAFASMHRAHASVAGISKYLPTYYGLLVKEEIKNLKPVITDIKRPFGVFMGGAKVDDKLKYIKCMLEKCDYLLIGGGIANSFLYACGYDVKNSLCTSDEITLAEIRNLIKKYRSKIIMPIDFVIDDDKILDLNSKSIKKYIDYLSECKTIFINGTCGVFEDERYATGTKTLFSALNDIKAIKIAGGGDTLSAINKFNVASNFDFLSSGGGASLEYISFNTLDAIKFIGEFSK